MDPQILQPNSNPNSTPDSAPAETEPVMSQTPAPAPIEPSAPQPLFAPDAPMPAPKKPKGKKVLIILLVLLLLGAVGAGAYYYFVMMKDSKDTPVTVEDIASLVAEPEVSAKSCLVAGDYDSIYKEVSGTTRPETTTYQEEAYAQELSFNPDSVDFATPASTNDGIVTAFATFTKANEATKEFKITITGHYANDKQTEKDLATKRAEKVKELLVKKGANAELIVVAEPALLTATITPTAPATDAAQTTAKTVKVSIDATCKTTETESTETPATEAQ